MTETDWNNKFGNQLLITLTDEERRYFALEAISAAWDVIVFYSKTNLWYTRVIAYFEGEIIKKVITETKRVLESGIVNRQSYQEYDTNLSTVDRKQLLPLTSRGKPKPLSASNINAVLPFGCRFYMAIESEKDTKLYLDNPRANKMFPVGEWESIAAIKTNADFHSFARQYICTCPEGYFDKLHTFMSAKKVTVKYKVGDIFRMDYNRTQYCYGIITGIVNDIKAMPELPKNHSLRKLMMIPIMVRAYQIITDNPNLTSKDLQNISLGRVQICGDNDIIWGSHVIVDHKLLEPEDIEFNLVCTKIVASPTIHETLFTQEMLMHNGLVSRQEYSLYVEWGFAQTYIRYDQMSDKLKEQMANYTSPHGGVSMSIDPRRCVPNEKYRQYHYYSNNLLNPENKEIKNEIFRCLGLDADATFDQYAKNFGGLTKMEILQNIYHFGK